MKKSMAGKATVFLAGLALSQSLVADDLKLKITDAHKNCVADYYNEYANPNLEKTTIYSPSLTDTTVVDIFKKRFPYGDSEEAIRESDAYAHLLPKFFEMVKKEAIKRPWFWKGDYKKSDWWKALGEKDGIANKFMAYLYNINDDYDKLVSGITATVEKGTLVYRLNDNVFHKESLSFFKRHRGKLALAGILAAGAGVAAWKYRDRLGYSSAPRERDNVRLDRSEVPRDGEKISAPSKSTVLYSPLEQGERERKPSFWSRWGQGWRERQAGNVPKLDTSGTENPLRTKLRERVNQLREGVNRFGERLNEYGKRAELGQQERIARATRVGQGMLEGGKRIYTRPKPPAW